MGDIKWLSEPGVFENFGIGSLILFGAWRLNAFSEYSLLDISNLTQQTNAFEIALAGIIVFLLYALGRSASVLGSAVGGLTLYRTILRYRHYTSAASNFSIRDWDLFLLLRRDLALIESLLGGAILLTIPSFDLLCKTEIARVSVLPLVFLILVILGCLNGIRQNRIRVEFLIADKSTDLTEAQT